MIVLKEITVPADIGNLAFVTDFVNSILRRLKCSRRNRIQIDVAIDEIFANIVHNAYDNNSGKEKGSVCVRVESLRDAGAVAITFIDSGRPFDPRTAKDPDVSLSLKKRPVGGLGIYMMKRSVDEIRYEYKDGQNILTIQKSLS